MLRPIPKWLIQSLAVTVALLNMATKWSIGVLVLKLLGRAAGTEDASANSSPLYQFVFLTNQGFGTVVVLSFVTVILLNLFISILGSLALIRSSQEGRKLRQTILDASCDGTATSQIGQVASELVLKVNIVEDFMAHDEHILFQSTVAIVISFALTFVFAWYAALMALALFVCSEIFSFILGRWREECHHLVEENKTHVNARLLDIFKNATTIRIMNMASTEAPGLRRLEEESDDPRYKDAWLKFWVDMGKCTLIGLIPMGMALVAWPLISNASSPEDALNTGFAILIAILLLDETHKSVIGLCHLADKAASYEQAQATINRFLGLDDEKEEDTQSTDPSGQDGSTAPGESREDFNQEMSMEIGGSDLEMGGAKMTDGSAKRPWALVEEPGAIQLRLEDVSLTYPDRAKPVFTNLNENFERGKIHALVGESGKGKSSMMKVLAGLVKPQAGNLVSWEGMKLAYVSQDQKLFARSIRENVTYGAKGHDDDDDQDGKDDTHTPNIPDEEIWEALEWANIADFVLSLPNGLDEVLEGGEKDVSGGQLQRLLLAHLYCTCKNADFVMLDEVLSALDEATRELLIGRLGEFLDGKTAIIVTHHKEMLRICEYTHEVHGNFSKCTRRDSDLAPPPRIDLEMNISGRLTGGSRRRLSVGMQRGKSKRSSIGGQQEQQDGKFASYSGFFNAGSGFLMAPSSNRSSASARIKKAIKNSTEC